MNLFQQGQFVLSSGFNSTLKIDCDALTDEDIETLAFMIEGNLWDNFGYVFGVPTGGLRLAKAMEKYARPYRTNRFLIVDDVWTTGGSMRKYRDSVHRNSVDAMGAVIFARRPTDNWVLPLFTMAGCEGFLK